MGFRDDSSNAGIQYAISLLCVCVFFFFFAAPLGFPCLLTCLQRSSKVRSVLTRSHRHSWASNQR